MRKRILKEVNYTSVEESSQDIVAYTTHELPEAELNDSNNFFAPVSSDTKPGTSPFSTRTYIYDGYPVISSALTAILTIATEGGGV